ncbi:hypothetical protein AVEN_200297-1 [Araneus ventricosus]|uniref:Uncharacterized protein n=1 Tax=Araneus ventricosus TaxID=182803 RepID=A0A4Y2HI02_ARAVE|nr:hypothetical protein AVEN_200297-1 [Araneus ventricosus]
MVYDMELRLVSQGSREPSWTPGQSTGIRARHIGLLPPFVNYDRGDKSADGSLFSDCPVTSRIVTKILHLADHGGLMVRSMLRAGGFRVQNSSSLKIAVYRPCCTLNHT